MKRSNRLRGYQSQRPTVKTVQVVASAVIISLCTTAAVLWKTFDEQPATADIPKIIGRVTAMRPATPVYKGTFMQPVLRVRIETHGDGKLPSLKAADISMIGTPANVRSMLSNPQFFITAGEEFNTHQKIKTEKTGQPDTRFSTILNHQLNTDVSYLWLTFDISNKLSDANATIFADCMNIISGAIAYEPTTINETAGVKILTTTTWYSDSRGNLNNPEIWNSERDGSGIHPNSLDAVGQTFFIQSGCVINNIGNTTISELVIEHGGTLQSYAPLKTNAVTITSGGIWMQGSSFEASENLSRFVILNGGNYLHVNNGPFPGKNHLFESGSTVLLGNLNGGDPGSLNWGNLIIDLHDQKGVLPAAALTNIAGSLDIKSGELVITGNNNVNIQHDLVISGGKLTLGTSKSKVHYKIGRNFIVKDGTVTDHLTSGIFPAEVQLSINRDIYVYGGRIDFGTATTIFPNAQQGKISKWLQKHNNVNTGNVTLTPGSALAIMGDAFGDIPAGCNFNIMHDARLDAGKAVINGPGTFIVNEAALLAVGHQEGIWSEDQKGNIRTEKRIYSSAAGYIYNSANSFQQTGKFKTVPEAQKVGVLRIVKSYTTDTLELDRNFEVSKKYTLINAFINYNGYKISDGADNKLAAVDQSEKAAR